MAAIDFITLLGRVLGDGALRDAFAANPRRFVRQIDLREADRRAFEELRPADLEFQARVLLRKRFDLVQPALPLTCEALGGQAFAEFARFARNVPPLNGASPAGEAEAFATHLLTARPAAVSRAELNRMRFVAGQRRFAVHLVPPAVHVFFRRPRGRWHEWRLFLRV